MHTMDTKENGISAEWYTEVGATFSLFPWTKSCSGCVQTPCLLSCVDEQAEADQDDEQVDICSLVPGFMHRVVYGLRLVPQKPASSHRKRDDSSNNQGVEITGPLSSQTPIKYTRGTAGSK